MKSLLITGITLLLISAFLFYFSTGYRIDEITPSHFMGVLGGIGIGLIIGGVVGYVSKCSSVKAQQKRKAMEQLQKEKVEIEKQAAEIAQQKLKQTTEQDVQKENPLN
jgi:hypothetical protein